MTAGHKPENPQEIPRPHTPLPSIRNLGLLDTRPNPTYNGGPLELPILRPRHCFTQHSERGNGEVVSGASVGSGSTQVKVEAGDTRNTGEVSKVRGTPKKRPSRKPSQSPTTNERPWRGKRLDVRAAPNTGPTASQVLARDSLTGTQSWEGVLVGDKLIKLHKHKYASGKDGKDKKSQETAQNSRNNSGK